MRLYIATPINARGEATLEEKLKAARKRVEYLEGLLVWDPRFENYSLCSTFDFAKREAPDPENVALATCVLAVLRSDAIYLDHGWQRSKGCRLEFQTAKIYNKKIFEHDKVQKEQNAEKI